MNYKSIHFLLLATLFFSCQQEKEPKKEIENNAVTISPYKQWTQLEKGMEFIEIDAPEKSKVNNSVISILRIEPEHFEFEMYNASQRGRKPLKASQWAEKHDLDVVFNAGMYDMTNGMTHRGYLKNNKHLNNRELEPHYNSMIAFQPKDSLNSNFDIFDLECQPWKSIKNDFNCYAQGMRMIDCNSEPLSWNKKKQSCSMLVAAKDPQGRIYILFTRSPYTQNQMISFMKDMPYDLSSAIYLEGGPETSLFIKTNNILIKRFGSYVTQTFANDDNPDFWPIPNVIGITKKNK